ncbi:MAG: tRNA dihydrouridine synthase DusB [Erysipelotrichaceae bacterium]
MWKIGNVEIQNQIVVAPMAGISNGAFRSLCFEFGAGLVFNEMVSDKAISYESEKTIEMTQSEPYEHPLVMQLFGSDVESMVKGAQYLDQHTDCDIIDINMGCPANKIVKSKGGSYLMSEPKLAIEIVEAVVKAVKKPVTVKIRLGFTHQSINCIELAQAFEKVGAKAISLHGRTRSDLYQGKANWEYVKQLKESLSIPVIGNGDITTKEEALRRLEETGCDAIMIGRGAIGNPFLIAELKAHFDNEPYTAPSYEERLKMCLIHAKKLAVLKGEKIAMKQMRGVAPWYLQGMPYSCRVKNSMNQIKKYEDLEKIINDYLKELSKGDKDE